MACALIVGCGSEVVRGEVGGVGVGGGRGGGGGGLGGGGGGGWGGKWGGGGGGGLAAWREARKESLLFRWVREHRVKLAVSWSIG